MRVLLVANYKPDRQKSMARYAGLLDTELRKRGYAAELIHPPPIVTKLVPRESRFFRWLAYLDKFIFFPPVLWFRARRADIVHVCDHSNSFYLRWTGKTPNLITAHDALAIRSGLGQFPQNPTRWTGVQFQRWILAGMARARNIVCVSRKTRKDFEALLPGAPEMTVIPNPLISDFQPAASVDTAAVRASCGLASREEYLLHISNGAWYKNRQGVVQIFAELKKFSRFRQVKLIIAGAPLSAEMLKMTRELRELKDVIQCVEPSEQQLRALYTAAVALLFPSLEEGFGWPILEAQACGCPVITSARSPMMDIAGPSAILVDPEDPVSAAGAIAERIDDRDAMRTAGFANLRAYSVDNAMDRYCELYRKVVSASPQALTDEARI